MSEEGVKRRLTTILAADVVGYSRLMAADEAGTLTSLKAIRRELFEPKTTAHHGRVVKLIGDGTLMEFGSVVDAVNFAVDVQRAIAERNANVHQASACLMPVNLIARHVAFGSTTEVQRELRNVRC